MFTFLCRHTGGDPRPGDDSLDAGWFAPDAAAALVTHPVERARLEDALGSRQAVTCRTYRRGGTGLLRSELALQRRYRDLGITTRREYVRNVVVRGGYRLVPEAVRRTAYRALIANRGGDHAVPGAAHGNEEGGAPAGRLPGAR